MSAKSLVRLAVLFVQLNMLLVAAHASDEGLGEMTVRVIDQVGVPEGMENGRAVRGPGIPNSRNFGPLGPLSVESKHR